LLQLAGNSNNWCFVPGSLRLTPGQHRQPRWILVGGGPFRARAAATGAVLVPRNQRRNAAL
jgi:hypothetical protein